MKRLLGLFAAVLVFAGCQGQGAPATDPFFGHTRVPPPGTGSISGGATDPYYGGSPYSTAPRYVPPAGSAPQIPPAAGGGQNYTPPGGTYDYQGSSWRPIGSPVASRNVPTPATRPASDRSEGPTPAALPSVGHGNAAPNGQGSAGRDRVIQVLHPRPKTTGSWQEPIRVPRVARASTAEEPQLMPAAQRAVEITDLPRAGRVTSATRPGSASPGSGFRLVSGTDKPTDSAGVTPAVAFSATTSDGTSTGEFTSRENYGHDPEYRWLRGKLEYSQIDRRWKLRYIPVHSAADRYGGSVVLPDPKVLSGCERGDFVEVRGQLRPQGPSGGYAPSYEVTEVKRLGQAGP